MGHFAGYQDAMIFAFPPPPITELGNATGFDLMLVDQGGVGHAALLGARNQLLGMAAQNPTMVGVRPNGQEDEPQYRLLIDWERARVLGISVASINSTISAAWGSSYVNDFIDRGRVKRVYMQGDATTRMRPDDLERWFVRNGAGQMVPFTAFARAEWTQGAPRLERYNGRPSMEILGTPAPGQTTGAAMDAIEQMGKQLPPGIGLEWTGLSYEERLSGNQAPVLYAISLLVVFLCLAALYESWAIPAAVMLVVPLGILGAVAATALRGLANDVYFQVGLLTTIGLAAKNAILIVEFAKEEHDKGASLMDAAITAARQRLRPILMTSLAFILGVLPLAISTGAGSGGQNAIGTGVIGGMISGTVLALLFVPVFFIVVLKLFKVGETPQEQAKPVSETHPVPKAQPAAGE
jgi:hydrophobe/amphiphile efflux-1 (HAE1) family protein